MTTIDSVVGINSNVAGSAAVVRLGTYSETWFHETGHALGLKHPHEVSVTPKLPGVEDPADKGTGYLNSQIYTAMGYTFPFLGEDNPFTSEIDFATPLNAQTGTFGTIDIAALQYIYGAREQNAGDDLYRFSDDVDFNKGYQAIWDTGGQDTIEYVGERRAKIDLRAATLEAEVGGAGWISTSETLTGGYTIAHGVTIENATGGTADDLLIGNVSDNVLDGGGGRDVLTGGGGADTFVFRRGQTNGDTVTDFAAGDRLAFHGFGAGATVTHTADPNTYAIRADAAHGGATETFQLTGVTGLRLGDVLLDRGASVVLRDGNGAVKVLDSTFGTLTEDPNGAIAVGNEWHIVSTSDFNGDGAADLLWRHEGGTFTEWQSTADGFAQNVYVGGGVGPDWTVAATSDFNGDGKSDLLWRHDSGTFTIWQSTGDAFVSNVYVDHSVGKDWHLQTAADFTGDGKADLLWRQDDGFFTIWQAAEEGFRQNVYADDSVGKDWHIAGTGDFNADGKSDLIFRNDAGVFTEWQSTGDGFRKNVVVDGSVSKDWNIAQIGDFNGDGAADLLWRNAGANSVSIWQSTGDGFTPNTYAKADIDGQWTVQAPLYDLI